MQKQNELQTSANCLEGSQNITYSLQIKKKKKILCPFSQR